MEIVVRPQASIAQASEQQDTAKQRERLLHTHMASGLHREGQELYFCS
ncbi:hypothetical protein [Pontibacter kalidii]|nr:hypothetical protein [Pontibacter kalidii]